MINSFFFPSKVSALSSSPSLSETGTFSTFVRVVSSDVAVAVGVVDLMLRYDWTRVSVITLQERIFTSVSWNGTKKKRLKQNTH